MHAMPTEEEEEDAFLESLIESERQEKVYLRRWQNKPLQEDSESRSTTEETSEDEEIDECEFSRAFIEFLSFSHAEASLFELGNLHSSSSRVHRRRHKQKERPVAALDDFLKLYEEKRQLSVPRLKASPEDVIDDEERKRIKFTVACTKSNVEVEVMVENHVYVTYFRNKYTKEDYTLNLSELAINLLRYGVQYSDNKFTKVTLKYSYGPSHYFFRSGAMVESGTYNPIIARKTHNMSMKLLREECGLDNIEIKERKCHNIVAKGTLTFGVRLLLLAQQYPTVVQYDDESFDGAIIRLNKIATFRKQHQKHTKPRKIHKKKCRIDSSFLNTRSLSSSSRSSSSSSGSDNNDDHDDDDDAIDSTSSSGEYEYLEKVDSDDRRYNQNFEYFEVDETELAEKRRESESQSIYKMVQKKPLKKKDLLQMHPNAFDLNQYEREALMKKKNVTLLIFETGRIICAGCRSTRNVLKAIGIVTPMVAAARDTPHNQKLEQMNTKTMADMIGITQPSITATVVPLEKKKRAKKKSVMENDRDLFESFKKRKMTK